MSSSGGLRRFASMCLPLFCISVLAAGCSKQGALSGKITYKGEPVKGGMVYFFPEGSSNAISAIIGTDGSYSISNLPRGQAKITVAAGTTGVPVGVMRQMGPGNKYAEKGMKQMGRIGRAASAKGADEAAAVKEKENITEKSAVPMKYANPEESGLSINVTGGSQKHDINLE